MTGTSVLTTKYTIDAKGNWIEVPIILTRSGNGWIEREPPKALPRKVAA